jgi:2-succinyl-5-enolpyruvyl-6-hydroxy-3-cyclohexene-1-carboxylate synthase
VSDVDGAAWEGETYAVVGALVDELVRAGVRAAVVSPGSRSTPVALALARQAGIALYVHPDERSAAYFGLGLAKATGAPVVLASTSGTAAANYLPAVAEARYGRVPLVLLTADRPPEARDVASAQTIDQVRLYGSHAKWSVDLPPPAPLAVVVRHARVVGARAARLAVRAPAGPVHVNVPLREPLVPDPTAPAPMDAARAPWRRDAAAGPYVSFPPSRLRLDAGATRALAAAWAAVDRGVVIAGPEPGDGAAAAGKRARAAAALARRLGWPLLADPLAAARQAPDSIRRHDAFLRDEAALEALRPDGAVLFGAPPVSRTLARLVGAVPHGAVWLVDDGGGYPDPSLGAAHVVDAEPAAAFAAVAAQLPPPAPGEGRWRRLWREVDGAAARAIVDALAERQELFEGRLYAELGALVPAATRVVVGNSMPVRDADAFFAPRRRGVVVLGNRGASGIDGVVSTALGVAAAEDGRPTLLVLGDLSFFHDLNGLVAARRFGLSLTVVVVQNRGGGIFSFLPQRAHGERFEELFGTPLDLDFEPAVRMHGGRFARVRTWPALRAAVRRGLAVSGLTVVEAIVPDRDANVALHEAVWRRVAAAVEPFLPAARGRAGAP